MQTQGRVLVWFSCGAASAAAGKYALKKYGKDVTEFLYCEVVNEHPDNIRFLTDVEKWLGVEVKRLRSDNYPTGDIYEVFTHQKYIAGIQGARCTLSLKRDVRKEYQRPDDTHVFGYTSDEIKRVTLFESNNPGLLCDWVLIDNNVSKKDCYRIIQDAGITLPTMYLMGYKNNNCIGCVKGGAGYWNKIRKDFPEQFDKMAKFSRNMGVRLIKLKGVRMFLDELPEGAGRYSEEPDFECGPQCVLPSTLEDLQ